MEMNKVFKDGLWSKEINVSDFVYTNITPYEGDASFLAGPTERTKKVWNECLKALEEERAKSLKAQREIENRRKDADENEVLNRVFGQLYGEMLLQFDL